MNAIKYIALVHVVFVAGRLDCKWSQITILGGVFKPLNFFFRSLKMYGILIICFSQFEKKNHIHGLIYSIHCFDHLFFLLQTTAVPER